MNVQVKRFTTGLATLAILFTVAVIILAMSPSWGDASPLAPTAAEIEPNNDFATANTFVIPGNMTGAITVLGDEDYFKIAIAAGQIYTVTITRTGTQERRIDIHNNVQVWVAGVQTDPARPTVSLAFQPQTTATYYIRVSAPNNDPTAGPTDYTIDVGPPAPPPTNTPTPTNTPIPTVTPTPTQTPMPTPQNIPGESEPNDTVATADALAVPGKIFGAIPNIYDVDCFSINTTIGLQYRLVLSDYGFNRWLKVYDNNGYYIMGNTTATNHEVELTLQAGLTRYYLCVSAVTTASPSNALVDYLLEVIILQPTLTPTSTNTPSPTQTPTSQSPTVTPKPTWPGGFDAYEPNYNFNLATTIASGLTYDLNFMPWGGATVDNDYFKIRVKPGLQLTCQTSDLDPGVDPRMVFYSGPAENYFIMANDDIALGDFNSRLSYYVTYEGFLYILIGQGDRMDIRDATNSDYSFGCTLAVPGANVTPAPVKSDPGTVQPTTNATATPQTPTSPIATPTLPPTVEGQNKELDFRLVTTPAPITPTPPPTGFRTFRVLVYYDANGDGFAGAGEGVPGFFVSVRSPETRAELARGYTDDQGQLSFTVPTVGTVRVLIPLLGFDRLVEAAKSEVSVRIAPPSLPIVIP
ncbi:MAG TPA: hypothetical protein PKZ84_20170 [Anaerolineae bacterium]|nr:hypothetical protein [Anaerolineae bacterium]HQI86918.1 hypothetical protein [Anaerolineae bacterium]